MDRPRGTGTAIGETDDGNIDTREEFFHLRTHERTFRPSAAHAAPELHLGSRGAQALSPDLTHPIPRAPQHVDAEAYGSPRELAYIRSMTADVVTERGCWIQNDGGGHEEPLLSPHPSAG